MGCLPSWEDLLWTVGRHECRVRRPFHHVVIEMSGVGELASEYSVCSERARLSSWDMSGGQKPSGGTGTLAWKWVTDLRPMSADAARGLPTCSQACLPLCSQRSRGRSQWWMPVSLGTTGSTAERPCSTSDPCRPATESEQCVEASARNEQGMPLPHKGGTPAV